jgi:hypothetical protein
MGFAWDEECRLSALTVDAARNAMKNGQRKDIVSGA